jgi:hypothetical protein
MKKTYVSVLALLFLLGASRADRADAASITESRIGLNTEGAVELSIQFLLSEPIDNNTSDDSSGTATWRIRNENDVLAEGEFVGFSRKAVRFLVEDPSPEFIETLVNNDGSTYLELDDPVTVFLASGGRFVLRPEDAETFSKQVGTLSARQQELIENHALGAYLMMADRLDLAREVNQKDSTSAEYAVAFSFTRPLFLIPDRLRRSLPVLWRAEGRLSSDAGSPLNYLDFSLSGHSAFVGFRVLGRPFALRALAEASFSGRQRLDTTAVSFHAGLEGLIPNLIDLTGSSSRLRPHPEIKLGGGYALRPQDQPLFNNEDSSWEAFGEIRYYIPVLEKYALTYEGKVRYTDNARSGEKVHAWNALTLSYDLPVKDLTTLVKWETGKIPFVSEEGERLLVGVALDYLPF